jgi:hypothetical protein
MWSRIFLFLLLAPCALAQAQASAPKIDNDFIHEQFSDSCNLESQWQPLMADLNGDGIEDLVVIARCKNPLIEQDEKNYKVVDPMDSFYGYGNTKITSGLGQEDPRLRGICVLVVHGAGPETWHAATPQAKFVIINIAVKTITLKKMKVSKKRSTMAIYLEEATGDEMTSALFWDGKKYRYEPLGSSME